MSVKDYEMKRRDFLKIAAFAPAVASLAGLGGCEPAVVKNDCRKSANKKRPNILWLMFDDGRADALGCYGTSWARTPNIDKIARNGVVFETAIVQNPVCVPSRRSMKTGNYCHQIGPMAMGKDAAEKPAYLKNKTKGMWNRQAILESLGMVPKSESSSMEDVPNLLDIWSKAGIKPLNVGKIHGFEQAWESVGDGRQLINVFGRPTDYFKEKYQDADKRILSFARTKEHNWQIGGVLDVEPQDTRTWQLGDLAVDKIEHLSANDEPFFLRVSFHAPHVPCFVPSEYFIDPKNIDLPLPGEKELEDRPEFEKNGLRKYAGSLNLTKSEIDICRGTYYGMVSLADVQVGRIIKKLEEKGLLKNTIIAINSDQGFQLGEHGLWKKRVFYEANVKSPLIISCPNKLPQGKRIGEPVEMIDFLPTLLEMSCLDVPSNIRGKSLMPLIDGQVDKWRTACFSEIDHSYSMYDELRQATGRRVMVRTKDYKLVFFMDERVSDKDGALYDLKNDPGETVNLYNKPEYKDVVSKLETYAYRWDQGDFF
jgi:arylsulfatase A-like enzyme